MSLHGAAVLQSPMLAPTTLELALRGIKTPIAVIIDVRSPQDIGS
jgi:hypothetical protein